MARYKGDPANTDYDAGDRFNYEVWTADTELTLCNVPWDATYKDVVHFDSTDDLNAYIDANGDITRITNASYARIDAPISIDMPLGRAQRYNYIRVYNPAQPVPGNDLPKYYYYFIRGVRHDAPNTTAIDVQLDVWQTYVRMVQFGRAYIERGHIGIANEHNFRNYGRDFLTVPEGLDIGSEYVSVGSVAETIMDPFSNSGEPTFNVLAISTVNLTGDVGTESAPKNPSAIPTYIQSGIPSGAGVYVWDTAADFMAFMRDFSRKPWVTAGLVSITLVPPQQRTGQFSGSKDPVTRARNGYLPPAMAYEMYKNWRERDVLQYIPERYRHLKKFLTSPYCLLQLTFNAGSSIILKPENWQSAHATIMEMLSIIPPNQRLAAIPLNYNGRNHSKEITTGGGSAYGGGRETTASYKVRDSAFRDGDYLDMAVFLSAFPTIPIVNNGQIAYLASSARSIAQQYKSADWAQQRALASNQTAFDQATTSINASGAMAENAMSADQAQTAIQQNLASQQALLGLWGGAGSGAVTGLVGGPLGAATGAVGGLAGGAMGMLSQGMQADAANQSLAQRLATASNAQAISTGAATSIRDSNKGLADWAARGDYANARGAIDAKVQDAQAIPNGMSGQFGGEAFNLAVDEMKLRLRVKMIDQAAISVIGEYWLRYGYPVRRTTFVPNDLRVMDRFSYWKMTEVYIRNAAMPEVFKQTIRGILEKGVTVWNDPSYIGTIDFANNRPLSGITIEGYTPGEWVPEPTPEPPIKKKRKKRKMLVYATNDGGMIWALAGTSPGTSANWRETRSETLANQYMNACGVDEPVLLPVSDYYEAQAEYLAPVQTFTELEGAPLWEASTAYTEGERVTLTGGEVLECTTAGTSDVTEPVAPAVSGTVIDGTVTWTRVS